MVFKTQLERAYRQFHQLLEIEFHFLSEDPRIVSIKKRSSNRHIVAALNTLYQGEEVLSSSRAFRWYDEGNVESVRPLILGADGSKLQIQQYNVTYHQSNMQQNLKHVCNKGVQRLSTNDMYYSTWRQRRRRKDRYWWYKVDALDLLNGKMNNIAMERLHKQMDLPKSCWKDIFTDKSYVNLIYQKYYFIHNAGSNRSSI